MISYLLYRIGQAIALRLPLKTAYSLAVFLTDLYCFFAYVDRARVTRNLKAIFPDKSAKEINRIRIDIFRNFSKYLVDFFCFEKINAEYVKNNVKLTNMHYLKEAAENGKGTILLTAHLGNWELGGKVISIQGFPFVTVALPHKSKIVNDFFNTQRGGEGITILPLGKAAKGCLRALRQNQTLCLVGDRDFTGKGRMVDFFGQPTIFPEGPAALSLQTGAAIIPGFMLRHKDDSFELIFERPIEYTLSGNTVNELKEITNKYKNVFEDYIRRYPEQWYMFRRFWK
ncbi:MAG: lysophospholipid acyltransferase family protein [Candidatus Omnitrophica bacterium]|nr:lysophospholipid acyltransferase family protein [Candidatus Omnitrophota bacterium]